MGIRRTGLCTCARADISYAFVCLIAFAGMVDDDDSRPGFLSKSVKLVVYPCYLTVTVFINILRQSPVECINDDHINFLFSDLLKVSTLPLRKRRNSSVNFMSRKS